MLSLFYFVILAVLTVATVACILFLRRFVNYRNRAHQLGIAALLFVWGGFFLSSTYLEYPPPNGTAVRLENGVVTHTNIGMIPLFCTPILGHECFSIRAGEMSASSHLHPVTENPKVRDLQYTVVFEISNLQMFLGHAARKRCVDVKTVEGSRDCALGDVNFWLNEFNEKNSKELAKFYNPLDPRQVEEFNALLQGWMSEPLRDTGITIRLTNFSI